MMTQGQNERWPFPTAARMRMPALARVKKGLAFAAAAPAIMNAFLHEEELTRVSSR
jgi:hypothetical protein